MILVLQTQHLLANTDWNIWSHMQVTPFLWNISGHKAWAVLNAYECVCMCARAFGKGRAGKTATTYSWRLEGILKLGFWKYGQKKYLWIMGMWQEIEQNESTEERQIRIEDDWKSGIPTGDMTDGWQIKDEGLREISAVLCSLLAQSTTSFSFCRRTSTI